MPYIGSKVRVEFAPTLIPLENFLATRGVTKGELNYIITRLMIVALLPRRPVHYGDVSEIIGAATDAAGEVKRRILDPLEDAMIYENGDVFPKIDWRKG